MVRFRKREFRHGRIELQLQPLEENRVKNASFRAPPTENAVPENEFYALTFAIDSSVERVECFEEFHRRACRLFFLRPFAALCLPPFKACYSSLFIFNPGDDTSSSLFRFSPRFFDR